MKMTWDVSSVAVPLMNLSVWKVTRWCVHVMSNGARHEPTASYKPDRNRELPVLDLEFLEQREHIAGIADKVDESFITSRALISLRTMNYEPFQVQVVIDG